MTVNGVTGPVATRQAKSRLLETFKKGNYEQFQEGKLRNGKQLPNESVMEYYYEVVSLCKSLDPNIKNVKNDTSKMTYSLPVPCTYAVKYVNFGSTGAMFCGF